MVGIGLGLIFSGVPVYLACISWTSRPPWVTRGVAKVDSAVQKLFYAVQEDGGKAE